MSKLGGVYSKVLGGTHQAAPGRLGVTVLRDFFHGCLGFFFGLGRGSAALLPSLNDSISNPASCATRPPACPVSDQLAIELCW